jgi:hypothetical protein
MKQLVACIIFTLASQARDELSADYAPLTAGVQGQKAPNHLLCPSSSSGQFIRRQYPLCYFNTQTDRSQGVTLHIKHLRSLSASRISPLLQSSTESIC